MSTYVYREDSGHEEQFNAANDEAAETYARKLLQDGDWTWAGQDWDDKTFRVRAFLARLEDGEKTDLGVVTWTIEPGEPPCPGHDAHGWREDDVSGHGGGVLVTERCEHCGLVKVTDTGDTDPVDGTSMATTAYRREGARSSLP